MDEKTETMYFIGDTHGLRPVLNIIDRHKLEGQNLIHVGDFGLGFVSIEQDVKNLLAVDEALIETNNELYVIRGNHDNPIFWDKSKGLNLPKLHNLHLVDDYTIYEIEGKNVLFVGGAISIDRRPRMNDNPWPSWWRDEEFVYKPHLLNARLNVHKTVDIVVTHTAPDFCHPKGSDNYLVNSYHEIEALHGKDLHGELAVERASVTEMYNDLTIEHGIRPKYWFYGHFHSSKKQSIDGTKFKLLNINELYEINQNGEGVPH